MSSWVDTLWRTVVVVALIVGMIYGIRFIKQQKLSTPKNALPPSMASIAKNYEEKQTPLRPIAPAALKSYNQARDDIWESHFADGEKSLQAAVAAQVDFTEAWYNLGATQANLAIKTMRDAQETEAVQWFRKAVHSKKQAKVLMDQNIWFLYNEAQRTEVRSDVEQALQDADEVLANEPALIAALKIWARP